MSERQSTVYILLVQSLSRPQQFGAAGLDKLARGFKHFFRRDGGDGILRNENMIWTE